MTETIIESSGNVFIDLGIPQEEAELLALRAKLLNELRKSILEAGWSIEETAQRLSMSQTRTTELVHGQHEKFSLEILVTLVIRLGKRCELRLAA